MDAASHVRCAAVIIWVAAITKCSSLLSLMFGWNQAPTDYQAVVNVATQLETIHKLPSKGHFQPGGTQVLERHKFN